MKIDLDAVSSFDSVTYRKIFEFIKKEGIEPLEKLRDELYEIQKKNIICESLFNGKHLTLGLANRNKLMVKFFRELGEFDPNIFDENNISYFIDGTLLYSNNKRLNSSEYKKRLDRFIENAKCLEQLKICKILLFNKFYNYYHFDNGLIIFDENANISDINKIYTDGEIDYFLDESMYLHNNGKPKYIEYGASIFYNIDNIPNPTWIIETENHENGRQFRYAKLFTWDFNSEYLPSTEELSSYKEPRSLILCKEKMGLGKKQYGDKSN